ncbi:class I SAM-dependent methyltransferase [Pseudomonas aeruginosa]
MACGLSPRGRRFRQRYPQLRYLEADLPPMAARKAALLREQGWLGPEHAVAAVDILAEDGERSLAALFAGLDRERPLVVITEGLVNYFQRPVIEAFWSRLATELKRFPQGTYLTDLYPDLREHPRYRQIRWGVGIIGRLTREAIRCITAMPRKSRRPSPAAASPPPWCSTRSAKAPPWACRRDACRAWCG